LSVGPEPSHIIFLIVLYRDLVLDVV